MIPKLQMEDQNEKKQNINLTIEVPYVTPEQQQFTFRQKKDKNKQKLKELQNKDTSISKSIDALRNRLSAADTWQQVQQDHGDDQKRNKNRSQVYTRKIKGQQNEEQNSHHEYHQRFNYRSKAELNNGKGINKRSAENYQNKIKYLEDHIDELQNKKYKREQYLIKVINKNSKLGEQMKASSSSISATSRSRISATFDVNEYMQNCEKQREQAKQIQMKALKLRKKEKLERELIKKMKMKLNTERSNVAVGMGIDMDISAVSAIERQLPENKAKANEVGKSNEKLIKVQALNMQNEEDDELGAEMNIDENKDASLPIFFNAEEMDLDKRLEADMSKQLKEQISNLKQEIVKSQKQLQSQKMTRENYQKHIFEIDSKNAEMTDKYAQRIANLEQQAMSKDEQIKKLESLLDQNVRLVKAKEKKIEQLYCQIKMKASLVDSFGFGNSSGSNGQEVISSKKQLQLVWNVLNKLRDSKEEYFKQFLIDSVVRNDKNSGSLEEQLKTIKQRLQLKEQEKQKQQIQKEEAQIEKTRERRESQQSISIHDQSSSDNNSVPSEAMSDIANQNEDLKHSVQLLSSKLKSIQNKLQQAQHQKNTLFLTHSSLQSRVMTLEEENTKMQQLKQKFSTENLELKHKLAESNNLSESLRIQKLKIREQSEANIKILMKMMQEQKNKEVAAKIEEIARQLQKDLKLNEQEKKKLEKKVKTVEFENDTFTNLNKQLESQVKSQQELSYQLQQVINKQKIQIQKLQESVDKIKDDNDKFIQRTELYEAEKLQWAQENSKLREEIESLNSLISNSNEQIMKFKIIIKQKLLESEEQNAKDSEKHKQLEHEISANLSLISKLENEMKENQAIIQSLQQSLKSKGELVQRNQIQLDEQQQKISQLSVETDVLNKKIEGFQSIIKEKNSQLKQTQQKINQNSAVLLEQQQNYKSQISMLQQKVAALSKQLMQKVGEIGQKQEQKLQIIQTTSLKIQQLETQLRNIQTQLELEEEEVAELSKLKIELQKVNRNMKDQQREMAGLQQLYEQEKEEHLNIQIDLDLSNKKIQQYSQKYKALEAAMKELQNRKPDLSKEISRERISQIYFSSMKQYNRELFEMCRHASLKVTQLQLIQQVSNYLPLVQQFVRQLSQYTEIRQHRLEGYLSKYDDIIEKQPLDVGIHTLEILSSPPPLPKQEESQKRSRFAVKAAQSLEVNLDLHEDYIKQQQKHEEAEKKSILLSQDFGSAFSHQDEENDHIDHIKNQRSMSRQPRKSEESLGFSGSTHSLVQQLQAQQQVKKQMRNLKMKAKQKRRKL